PAEPDPLGRDGTPMPTDGDAGQQPGRDPMPTTGNPEAPLTDPAELLREPLEPARQPETTAADDFITLTLGGYVHADYALAIYDRADDFTSSFRVREFEISIAARYGSESRLHLDLGLAIEHLDAALL